MVRIKTCMGKRKSLIVMSLINIQKQARSIFGYLRRNGIESNHDPSRALSRSGASQSSRSCRLHARKCNLYWFHARVQLLDQSEGVASVRTRELCERCLQVSPR